MPIIVILVFCGIISLGQPVAEAAWSEACLSTGPASFQFPDASAPYGVLLDFLRDAGSMELCAGLRDLPVLDFDLGYPILGAEIAGIRSTDCQTSASQADAVAPEGAVLPPTVIVADDFGLDSPTTSGILHAFDEGLISATSSWPTCPASMKRLRLRTAGGCKARWGFI